MSAYRAHLPTTHAHAHASPSATSPRSWQLSLLMTQVLVVFRKLVLMVLDRLFDTAATKGVSGRSSGMSGKAVDVSGDGQADFVAPPPGHVFWTQELLPASLLWVFIQLASAAIFTQVGEERITNFGNAFYHCCITATTCVPRAA